MSIHDYSIPWSEHFINRIEGLLRDVHTLLGNYYDQHQYGRKVLLKTLKGSLDSGDKSQTESSTIDSVSPAGSFMLRTTVHKTPYENDHADSGIGADVVVTMPDEVCSEDDLRDGRYLEKREEFVLRIAEYLKKVQKNAILHLEEGRQPEKDENDNTVRSKQTERLARMDVSLLPIHNCHGCSEKKIIRLRFRRRCIVAEEKASSEKPSSYYETPYVDLHFRPHGHCGSVSGAKGTRKHPLYSYLVLEDYMMPYYLQKLHRICVDSPGLRRAIVLLKCWSLHMGLHAATSGHSEGLSGFSVAAIVAYLVEEGVLNTSMNEEVAARAVLAHISNGGFTSKIAALANSRSLPVAEEKGEVAVLRFAGESLNILFRSSASFFKLVVESAAREALQYPKLSELFSGMPFQPIALRHDITLQISNCAPEEARSGDEAHDNVTDIGTRASPSLYFSPSVQWAQRMRLFVLQALQSRATDVTVWPTSRTTLQLTVLLTSESDGRKRLTKGPPVEDTAAVEAFNTFWGADITSTRQFADGAIYRCVLWEFPDSLPATSMTQRIVEYALRKHFSAASSELEESTASSSISVTSLLGNLEDFLCERVGGEWKDTAPLVRKPVWEACKSVQGMIAKLPKSAVPCKITGFDIISATERQTEVFPVRPHLALTFSSEFPKSLNSADKATMNLMEERYVAMHTKPTLEPIHCVLTIDDRRRIPDDLEAIQLMKAAIGAQLSTVLQAAYGSSAEAAEDGSSPRVFCMCHPHGVDIALRGLLFRIYVAHYREVSLLRALQMTPRADLLEQKLFWSVQHAKLVRTISFGHPTFSAAVRLAKRWVSAMLLHEFIPSEVIELLVAHAYLLSYGSSNKTSSGSKSVQHVASPPKTAASGFIRFIELIATHPWDTPLVIPTTDENATTLEKKGEAAELIRKQWRPDESQQAMFIAAPYAPTESPFTKSTPRQMILHRLVELAREALSVLMRHLRCRDAARSSIPVEALLFKSSPLVFDFALPLHTKALLHSDRSLELSHMEKNDDYVDNSSTENSPLVRVWQLDEVEQDRRAAYLSAMVERDPVGQAVRAIRAALRDKAMVFYDCLAPSLLYIVALKETTPSEKELWKLVKEICGAGAGVVLPQPLVFAQLGGSLMSADATMLAITAPPDTGAAIHKAVAKKKESSNRKRHPMRDENDTKKRRRSDTATHGPWKKSKRSV